MTASGKMRLALNAVLIVVLVFSASLVAAQKPVHLKLKHTQGDVDNYAVRLEGKSLVTSVQEKQDTTMSLDLLMRWKVLEVDDEGLMNVSVTMQKGEGDINGNPEDLPNVGESKIMKLTRQGRVVAVTPSEPGKNYFGMQFEFPDKALAIGDSWTSMVILSPRYPMQVESTNTLTGFEKVDGTECAVIKTTVREIPLEGIDDVAIHVESNGKMYFDYEGGRLVRSDVKSTMKLKMPVEVAQDEQAVKGENVQRFEGPDTPWMEEEDIEVESTVLDMDLSLNVSMELTKE